MNAKKLEKSSRKVLTRGPVCGTLIGYFLCQIYLMEGHYNGNIILFSHSM